MLEWCPEGSRGKAGRPLKRWSEDLQRFTTQIEGAITGSGNNTYALYDVYAHVLALPELMNNTMECKCLPGSGVFNGSDPGAGPGVPAMCNYTTQPATTHSPIRDWWGGYEGVPLPRAPGSPQRGPIEASLCTVK